jgi:hypothetical protein
MADSSSTYLLSILLKLKDEGSKGVDNFAQKLASLDKQSTKTLQSIKKITDALKGLQLNNLKGDVKVSGLDSLQSKLRSIKQDIGAVGKGLGSIQSGGQGGTRRRPYQMGDWMKDSDQPHDWHKDLPQDKPTRRAREEAGKPEERRGFFDRVESLRGGLEAPGQIASAWRERTDSLREYTDAYLELSQAKQRFLSLNLSASENTEAFGAVDKTVQSIRGLTHAGTVETLTDLHTALGNLDHAIEALPIASKYKFGISTLLGDKFSSGEIEQQIQQGFRFLEMVNAVRATGNLDAYGKRMFTAEDRQRMETYFNRVAQITAATGGRVTPAELLQMAQTGGTATQGLTLAGLTNLTAVVTEMGGSRTGTALQTLFQQVIAGRIQQKGLLEWQRLGLLDSSKVEYNKSGIVKSIQSGAIPIGDKLQKNPLAFTDALRDAMKAHGIDTSNPDAVIKELGALKMPRTAMEITSLLINQRDRIIKDAIIAANAKDIEGTNKQALDSDMGKIKAYEAAMTDFKAKAGAPMLEFLTSFAEKATPVLDFFSQHEKVAEWGAGLLVLTKAGTGAIETLADLKQSGIIDWFTNTKSGAKGAAKEIKDAEDAAGGLGNKLSLLSTLKIGIAVTVAGFTIEQFLKELDEIEKWRQRNEQNVTDLGQTYEKNQRLFYGKDQSPAKFDEIAQQAFATITDHAHGMFTDPYQDTGPSAWFSRLITPKHAFAENIAENIKNDQPGLQTMLSSPGMMAAMIKKVEGSRAIIPEAKEDILGAFEVLNKNSYAVARLILADESAKNLLGEYARGGKGPGDRTDIYAGSPLSRIPTTGKDYSLQLPTLMKLDTDTLTEKLTDSLSQQILKLNGGPSKPKTSSDTFTFTKLNEGLSQPITQLTTYFTNLAPPAQGVSQSFSDMRSPAERLPSLLGQVGSAASGLITRLNDTRPTFNFDLGGSILGGNTGGGTSDFTKRFGYNPPDSTESPTRQSRARQHRARGGPVKRDSIYQIGEEGPEWFTPERDGFITPNHIIRQFKREAGPERDGFAAPFASPEPKQASLPDVHAMLANGPHNVTFRGGTSSRSTTVHRVEIQNHFHGVNDRQSAEEAASVVEDKLEEFFKRLERDEERG